MGVSATPFDFIRTPNADISMSSLQAYVPGVSATQILRVLGEPDPHGYEDDEKGYDGRDYVYTEVATGKMVHLYARYSEWRVGAFGKAEAERFAAWVKAVCQ